MILAAVLAVADADDDIDWTVSVDSTVVRAHQHAAGAYEKGAAHPGARRLRARTLPRRAEHEVPSESLITWAAITLMTRRITRRQSRRAGQAASREGQRD
jgi:hypothetical protein